MEGLSFRAEIALAESFPSAKQLRQSRLPIAKDGVAGAEQVADERALEATGAKAKDPSTSPVIATGEQRRFANLLLTIGVVKKGE